MTNQTIAVKKGNEIIASAVYDYYGLNDEMWYVVTYRVYPVASKMLALDALELEAQLNNAEFDKSQYIAKPLYATETIETDMTVIEITLPRDMLWQDMCDEDYDRHATETQFANEVVGALAERGYAALVNYDDCATMKIWDADGEDDSADHDHIRMVIDSIEVSYIL